MSDTKQKILQVLNDNYMVNLFSAQAREHIASKIVDNLDGKYNSNPAPEGTVRIQDVVEEKSNSNDSVNGERKSKPNPKSKTPVNKKQVVGKKQTDRKRSSLRNLKK